MSRGFAVALIFQTRLTAAARFLETPAPNCHVVLVYLRWWVRANRPHPNSPKSPYRPSPFRSLPVLSRTYCLFSFVRLLKARWWGSRAEVCLGERSSGLVLITRSLSQGKPLRLSPTEPALSRTPPLRDSATNRRDDGQHADPAARDRPIKSVLPSVTLSSACPGLELTRSAARVGYPTQLSGSTLWSGLFWLRPGTAV